MGVMETEKLQQIGNYPLDDNSQGETGQEEHVQQKRGRKKRVNKNSTKPVNFRWSWDLDARLEHYRAERSREEHRTVERNEVVEQAVDEFLTKEGY